MSERVSIDQLVVGMYLVGIDKPWLETPFLRHHFKISSESQITKLRNSGVKLVDVDPQRGITPTLHDGASDDHHASPEPDFANGNDDSSNLSASPITPSGSDVDGARSGNEGPATRIYRTDNAEGITEFTTLLRVRMLLQLAFPSQRQHALCAARLLGWSDHNFLLTELPFSDGRAIEFRPGNPCIVRFVESGRVFGFKTETIRGQFSPVPLLFVTFPREIEELCLRRSPRVAVTLNSRLRLAMGTGAAIDGIVRDLSLSGCRVELTSPQLAPLQGAAIALDLDLPNVGTLSGLQGVIRNVSCKGSRAATEESTLVLGVEFEFQHTDPGAPAAVEHYVNEQLPSPQTSGRI